MLVKSVKQNKEITMRRELMDQKYLFKVGFSSLFLSYHMNVGRNYHEEYDLSIFAICMQL